MAQLELAPHKWAQAQTRDQFRAVAWLRWRITVNQFRKKGGSGELVGSIIMWLLFTSFALGMMFLAALMAGFCVGENHTGRLDLVLWGAFFLTQFVNIQVGQPGTVFDPTQLIRFPMNARSYIFLRLFFGLLTPGNILIALLSYSIATGITVAAPSLWLYAFVGMTVFAITNALFSRMIFAWVDRWLATRRAREIFTAFLVASGLGAQYLNVHFNPAYDKHSHGHHTHDFGTMRVLYHASQPYTRPLPPGLLATSITKAQTHNIGAWALDLLACLAFAAVFYAIFAWRTATEFRGENLTDAANGVRKPKAPVRSANAGRSLSVPTSAPLAVASRSSSSQVLGAVLQKELLQIRRNVGFILGIIAPVFFVFLFAGRISSRSNSPWIFPVALVYVMFGIAPMSYNSFGLEAEGAQFYFMTPASMRHVLLAKNLVGLATAAIEVLITLAVIHYVAVLPGASILIASILWVAATMFIETMVGNRRSITTPKRIEPGRTTGKQASQVSALIGFGILLASAAFGGCFLTLTMFFGHAWLLVPVFAVFAVVAGYLYHKDLDRMDAFAYTHKENLIEVLSKKATV